MLSSLNEDKYYVVFSPDKVVEAKENVPGDPKPAVAAVVAATVREAGVADREDTGVVPRLKAEAEGAETGADGVDPEDARVLLKLNGDAEGAGVVAVAEELKLNPEATEEAVVAAGELKLNPDSEEDLFNEPNTPPSKINIHSFKKCCLS